MDVSELKAILSNYREGAVGADEGELSNDRKEALDHFHGRPYGDEVEGRSSIVTRDLAEAVDSVLAPCLKTILGSGNAVEFEPRNAQDVEQAKLETLYTNYVIMERNPGFMVFHDAIQDALVLKNGYVFAWWDESKESGETDYKGLSELDKSTLENSYDNDDDILEWEIEEESSEEVNGVELFSLTVRWVKEKSQVRIEAFPPEEIKIDANARGQAKDASFLEHEAQKTRTELIEMGIPQDFLEGLGGDEEISDSQEQARSQVNEEDDELTTPDPSMTEHMFRSTFVRVDFNGDGVAELRHVISVDGEIPDGEDWNQVIDGIDCASFSAKRIAHRHLGISLDDVIEDIQRINTVLTRQMLDNVYLTNWGQTVVNDNVVMEDFLVNTPAGVKRTDSIGPVQNDVMMLPVQPIAHQILPILDRVEINKSKRTGISATTDGTLDPNVLRETNTGVMDIQMSRALEKIEFYIRMLVETGLKDLVKIVHKLIVTHQDKPDEIQVLGQPITINPRHWEMRENLKINVGLGNQSKQEKLQSLFSAVPLVQQLGQFGMVGPQQAFNLFSDISEQLGFVDPTRYVLDPNTPEFAQMQQSRQQQSQQQLQALRIPLEQEQIRTQGRLTEAQIKSQTTLTQEKMRALRDQISQDKDMQQFLAQLGIDWAEIELKGYELGVNSASQIADLGGQQGVG